MAEHLKNGAEVLARFNNIVLAKREGTVHPFVTWRMDADDNAYWGRYFANYETALFDLVKRGASE